MPEFQNHDFPSKQKPQFRIFIKCNHVLINSYSASEAANILSIRFRPNQSLKYPATTQDLHVRNGQMAALARNKPAGVLWCPGLRLAILK
jgi:hypothetical protein